MQLDRSPGTVFDVILRTAVTRARSSADEAQRLLDASFPGPAYVWAVRSIEIFVKEVMLLPLFLEEEPEGEWDVVWQNAWKRVSDTFGSGKWDRALRRVDVAYGPLDRMHTDDGRDVWAVWKSTVVPRRGNTVHGKPTEEGEITPEEAVAVVGWALQMMRQLSLRLVAARKHPFHDLIVGALNAAQDQQL
jgi:hypothetical protein